MSANFSPEMEGYSGIQPFRFWCQKVLPLVYDDSLSYYELLCKVVDYLNHTIEDLSATETNVQNLKNAYDELEAYVNNYFDNLNVQNEINNKLDAMASDGSLYDLIEPYLVSFTAEINNKVNSQNSAIAAQNLAIDVLEGRMDEFSRLPAEGLSTAADAELVDIRVGADGVTYADAGTAVRTQVTNLKNALPSIAHSFYSVIANNTDYDTLTTPGTYIVASSANAQTMTHCPTIWAHKMYVIATTSANHLYQILMENSGETNLYMRYRNTATWSGWNEFATMADIPTTDIANIKDALPSLTNTQGLWRLISSGTNYNDLTTPGTYICVSFSSGLTMVNCPTAAAHKMFVLETTASTRIYQILFANGDDVSIYKRVFNGTSWSTWKKDAPIEASAHRLLIIGDSYSRNGYWINGFRSKITVDSFVNLAVSSATIKDKYADRSTYPYTSRPVSSDNTGNHNTFMCQIEKLKRLMTGTDLDEGESQIYVTESSYPDIIFIQGGENDAPDSSGTVDDYSDQFIKKVNNVYVADTSTATPSLGTAYIKLPSNECDRTCFAGAYRSLVEELQTLFPKAQIFAISRSLLSYWNSDRFPNVTNVRLQQELACNMVGINFINWQSGPQINLMNNYPNGSGTENDPYCRAEVSDDISAPDTNDLLHPNTLGGKKFGMVVAKEVENHFMNMNAM